MTTATIQHILSGLKGEIAREKDRERVQALCIMGMFYSRKIMTNALVCNNSHTIVCKKCKQDKPETCFTLNKCRYKHKVYVYRWTICRECINQARRKIKGKGPAKPEKGPKLCSQCRELLPLIAFSTVSFKKTGSNASIKVYRRNVCSLCMSSNSLKRRRYKMLQALTLPCG